MALAIFTDQDANFFPRKYIYEYHNTKNTYEFEGFKLLHKTEQELNIPNNPFSIVMLAARKALVKQNLNDDQQFIWKKSLVMALKDANYTIEKIRKILDFIRYYVRFQQEDHTINLDEEIQSIFKLRKNMGIEEAIKQEIRENLIKEGLAKGELQTKVNGIKKALQKGKYSLEEIIDLFDVSQDFVLKVKRGEL